MIQADDRLTLIVDEPDLVISAEKMIPALRAGPILILGSLFERGSSRPIIDLSHRLHDSIEASGGRCLIDTCWGNYVAFLRHVEGGLSVVRAPFGDLGCYTRRDDGHWAIASDAAFLRDVSAKPLAIDWPAIVRHLIVGELVRDETCLEGVREVRGGDCLRLELDGVSRSNRWWSPWQFTKPLSESLEAEAERVRASVLVAVEASVASFGDVLLMLSGGLDSSIVASCLGGGRKSVTAMTLVTADRAGDERPFARLAADAAAIPLIDVERNAGAIDLTRSHSVLLPRPTARSFTQESELSSTTLAMTLGAGAIFDGGGGDHVFCSHRSVAAVADSLLTGGSRARAVTTARVLCDLTGSSLPTVLLRGARRAWLRPRTPSPSSDTTLLNPETVAAAGDIQSHPWLDVPAGEYPGKGVHVGLIAAGQAVVESCFEPETIPRVSPLLTQPVVETCLSIPSWRWFDSGRDRAAARRAFAPDLPARLIDRRSKGSPNAFAADLVDRYRSDLRNLLLNGHLERRGIVDVETVRTLLDNPAPARDLAFVRLLRLADVEAWIRAWR